MTISLIVAVSRNGVIGRGNQLPWHLKPDLQRFKRLTMGKCIIVGRRTFESIGRPLQGRTMIVVTRRDDYRPDGVLVAHSVDEALAMTTGEEVLIAGGAELYGAALGVVDRLYLTTIDADFAGDTFMPKIDLSGWRRVEHERHEADGETAPAYEFATYDRHRRSILALAEPPTRSP